MGTEVKKWVSFRTERECRFALRWLNKVESLTLPMPSGSTLEILNKQINQILNSNFLAGTQSIRVEEKVRELEVAVKDNILSDDNLGWLKRNKIVALCLWWQLRTYHKLVFFRNQVDAWKNYDIILSMLSSEDESKLLSTICIGPDERLKFIVDYLDSFIIPHSNVVFAKTELLDDIKNKYINERSVRWSPACLMKKDKNSCEWAWKYISDYQNNHGLKNNKNAASDTIQKVLFVNTYHPDESDLDDYITSVYAAFELWDEGIDARELFVTRISRAWNQYTLRNTRKDKKPINCYVSSATKNKLDKYCKETNRTITDVIETLIKDNCKSLF